MILIKYVSKISIEIYFYRNQTACIYSIQLTPKRLRYFSLMILWNIFSKQLKNLFSRVSNHIFGLKKQIFPLDIRECI